MLTPISQAAGFTYFPKATSWNSADTGNTICFPELQNKLHQKGTEENWKHKSVMNLRHIRIDLIFSHGFITNRLRNQRIQDVCSDRTQRVGLKCDYIEVKFLKE